MLVQVFGIPSSAALSQLTVLTDVAGPALLTSTDAFQALPMSGASRVQTVCGLDVTLRTFPAFGAVALAPTINPVAAA